MTDHKFYDKLDNVPQETPSPATDPIIVDTDPDSDDVAKLLRDVAALLDPGYLQTWKKEDGSRWWKFGDWVMNEDTRDFILLGAICADCDARNWLVQLSSDFHDGELLYSAEVKNDEKWCAGEPDRSPAFAVADAFRDALRAARCTCEPDVEWHWNDCELVKKGHRQGAGGGC